MDVRRGAGREREAAASPPLCNIKGNGATELFRQVKQDGARFKNANGLDGAIVNQSWIFEFGLRSTNADPNWSPLQMSISQAS
jgi:hypothetical protein